MSKSYDLLDSFLSFIFDMPVPSAVKGGFMVDNELNEDLIVRSPLIRLNLVYGITWKFIFKTYHPTQSFYRSMLKHNISFSTPIDDISIKQIIDDLLKGLYIIKAGLIAKINIISLNNEITNAINSCKDFTYIRNQIVLKISGKCNRDSPPSLDTQTSLLYTYFQAISKNLSYMEDNLTSLDSSMNVFNEFHLHIEPNTQLLSCNVYENTAFIMYNDNYFLSRLLISPVIILDVEDYNEWNEVIDIVSQVSDKKCMLFVYKNVANTMSVEQLSKYHIAYIYPDMHYLLPKISPWCLLISDGNNSTNLNGLAFQPEHNIILTNKEYTNKPKLTNRVISTSVTNNNNTKTPHIYKLWNTKDFWSYHMKYVCPLTTNHAIHNNLLYIDFMYSYYNIHKDAIDAACLNQKGTNTNRTQDVIITVDNRRNELTVLAVKFAIYNTEGWDSYVYTSDVAVEYYSTCLPNSTIKPLSQLNNKFDIDIYNDILQDLCLWQDLQSKGYKHALIVQDDGTIIKKGINRFLTYDYIGAPWVDTKENEYLKANISKELVGNGGMSLRNISKMVDICNKFEHCKKELFFHNINRIPEDVFFVKYLTLTKGIMPTKEIASTFSIEQVLNKEAIGFHKFWVYHPWQYVSEVFNSFLGV